MKNINNYIIFSLLALFILACDKPVIKQDNESANSEKINMEVRNLSETDIYSLKRISDIQLSPDGKWVLFNLATPSIKDNKLTRDLYIVSTETKDIKRITNTPEGDFNARWSKDGNQIAYITSKDTNTSQIFVFDLATETSKQITNVKEGVSNIGWSPNNEKFFFTKEVKIDKSVSDLYPEYDKANIRIYNQIPVRHWDHWIDENYSHLCTIDKNGNNEKDQMKNEKWDTPLAPFGGVEEIAWSPDGKEIAYTCKKMVGKAFAESTDSDIYLLDLASGNVKNITKGMVGYDKVPSYSPDGKWIAFHSQERASFESDKIRLMLYNRSNGEITELTKSLDQWVEQETWSKDSKSLYITATDSGTVKIINIDLNGIWKYVTPDLYDYAEPQISKDGKTLVYLKQNMLAPYEIYKMELKKGKEIKLTSFNDKLLQNVRKATITQRYVKAKDGKMIHTWVLLPPQFDSTKKYPMISYCQGGPQSMISQNFHYRWNYALMAAKGYVVMLPNRRGVPGWGQSWNDAISGDWGGLPMQDILACTDELAAEPWVDENRLAAVGASAGGYAVFWLEGNHNKRFKAFISHCGVFNMESMYGSTEELWFPNWENGGPYWDKKNQAFYLKNSPHRYAQNWDTPIMISTGENDFRVPYTQSLEAYTVAQVKGLDSKLVVLPNESHFIGHPQEFIIWSTEFFKFLDKYCK